MDSNKEKGNIAEIKEKLALISKIDSKPDNSTGKRAFANRMQPSTSSYR